MSIGSHSIFRLRMEAFAESLFNFRCLGKRRALRPARPESDEEEARLCLEAPVDDNAALRLLEARGLLDDLEAEWPDDEGWLDRIVCGTLQRKDGKGRILGSKRKEFLGLIIVTNPAPVAASAPEQPVRYTAIQGPFQWPCWCGKRPQLRVDWLHLLPPSGASSEPLESIDLSRLVQQPQIEAVDENEVKLTLDFGMRVIQFRISGRPQAMRWAQALKAAVSSTLATAAEPEGLELVKELQLFDRRSPEERVSAVRREHRRLLEDLATQAEQEAGSGIFDSAWRTSGRLGGEEGLAAWVARLLEGSGAQASTGLWVETLERVAALPRVLLRAAVCGEPRMDVLEFWTVEHHAPLCKALELLWNARIAAMLPGEVYRFATFVDAYRNLLVSAHIDDPSLGPAVAESAEVYGRRFFPSLADLAARVAELAQVRQAADGRCSTSAPGDLLGFLGPACEAALVGPVEMRHQAAKLVDGAVYRYQKSLRSRVQEAEVADAGVALLLVAALIADCDSFSERCGDLLSEATEISELDEGSVADIFSSMRARMRTASEAYCEKLVTLALRASGVVTEFGSPLSMDKVWQANAKRLAGNFLTPAAAACLQALPEAWRRPFAERFLTRFVAFELFLLLHVQGNVLKQAWFYSPQKVATALQDQQTELSAAAAAWFPDGAVAFAKCLAPLGDVAAILVAPADQLSPLLGGLHQRHAGAFDEDVAKRLLLLRPELSDAEKKSALAGVASTTNGSLPGESPAKRQTYVPEYGLAGKKAVSAFQWASQMEWIKEVCLPPTSQVARTGPARSVASAGQGKDARKASVLDLDSFLESGENSLEDFLAGGDLSSPQEADGEPVTPKLVEADADDAEAEDTYHDQARSDTEGGSEAEGSDDELEEQEAIRGYLYKYEKAGTAVNVGVSQTVSKLLSGKLFSAAATALDAGKSTLKGGWVQRYFTVKCNMRSERLLCWYGMRGDRVARGSLRVSDILEVLPIELPQKRVCKVGLLVRFTGAGTGVHEQLELRTPYAHERDLWLSKLELLRAREASALAQMDGPRATTVLCLPPALHIRDPDRLGEQ